MSVLVRFLVLFAVGVVAACGPSNRTQGEALQAIGRSHVDANMPPADELDAILYRDLKAFAAATFPDASSNDLQYAVLGMKQVGIGWPRLYIMVHFDGTHHPERSGLLSAVAKEQDRFEIERFVALVDIEADPAAARKAFPAEVFQWLQEAAESE